MKLIATTIAVLFVVAVAVPVVGKDVSENVGSDGPNYGYISTMTTAYG